MTSSIERIKFFLPRYKRFLSDTEDRISKESISSIQKLFSNYKLLKPRLDEINKYEAEYFNIFNILKLDYSEVRVHTPFIANLLNPKGTHAQGDLFYKAFIEMVLNDEIFEKYNPAKITINDEHSFDDGQIDIFIEHCCSKNPYAIVLENKINAGDQKDQLKRYKMHLDSLTFIKQTAKRIIYLKPLRSLPTEYSVDVETLAEWRNAEFIKIISYKVEIIEWLTVFTTERPRYLLRCHYFGPGVNKSRRTSDMERHQS